MSARGAGRKKPAARRSPTRSVRERFLILTEGARTEKDYLEGFARRLRGALVEVVIPSEHGMPLTLVQAAKRRRDAANEDAVRERDDNVRFDAVWCVFDVDAHPNLKSAIEEARTSGIEVAVSNPCFELWLLLHFRDNPGPRTPDDMLRLMRACLPGYDKHIDIDRFVPSYAVAVARGRRLTNDAVAIGEPHRNPSTGVWRLTEAILSGVETSGSKRGATPG